MDSPYKALRAGPEQIPQIVEPLLECLHVALEAFEFLAGLGRGGRCAKQEHGEAYEQAEKRA